MAGIDLRMYTDQVEKSINRLPQLCLNCQYYDEEINSCNSNNWNKDCPLAKFVKENNIFYSKQQKTGRWILMSDADGYYYCCSECGEELPRISTELPTWEKPYPHKESIDKTNFCPSCGADMRGEQYEISN